MKMKLGSTAEVPSAEMNPHSEPVEVTKEMKLKLTPGPHVLTLAVNKKERAESVRIELKDVAGSAAQGRWVLGR